VWPGLVVEEANLHVQVSSLRKLLGSQVIATIPGRGYRLAIEPERVGGDTVDAVQARAPDVHAHADARRHNLNAASEALIGREADVDALMRLLDQHRLVTVVGSSGIGKTRLAQHVARQRLMSVHADGVWWVDLAVLRAADQIAPAIAQAAGLALGDGDAPRLLRLALETRDTLLVLDNCEHLVGDVSALVTTLLDASPRLRLLATSQEPLKARAEQAYRLEGLAVPPGPMPLELARCFAAVQLLEQRAQAVDHRFWLSDASVPSAIELCRQLDGIALAIEMAAGMLPTLGFDEVHARLGDRLRLLRSTSRAAPARHQTLGATLEWSHALLLPTEQTVLRRLSVFAGNFRLEAALAVAADGAGEGANDGEIDRGVDESAALDALFALVDKSLLQVVDDEPPRYRLLETTRLFAAQRLNESGEASATAQRHCRAMAALAVEAERTMWQMGDRPWLERWLDDDADLQSALARAFDDRDATLAADLAAAGAALDHVRGSMQGRRARLAAASALLPLAQGAARAKLLSLFTTGYASTAADGGISRSDAAVELVDIWRALGDTQRLYEALGRRALVAAMTGDRPTAEAAITEGRQLEQPLWPVRLRERFRIWLTGVQSRFGDAVGYAQTVREILALAEAAALENSAAMMQAEMVDLALLDRDVPRAVEIGHKAMASLHRLGMTSAWGLTAAYLCGAQALVGRLQEARECACKALPVLSALGVEGLLWVHVALLCARTDRPVDAARLLGCSQAWYTANHNAPDSTMAWLHGVAEAEVEAALGRVEFERRRIEGSALPAADVVASVRGLIGAGNDIGSEPRRSTT
jgi:predicted ATPase